MTKPPSGTSVVQPQLAHLIQSIEAQTQRVREWVAEVPEEVFLARPSPDKWSMAEHLAHLCLVNPPYLAAINEAVEHGRREGILGSGPFRGRWFAARFVRSMEPPPRWRFKTLKEMKPAPQVDVDQVVARFEAVQREYVESAQSADGLHLARLTFRSPFVRALKFALFQGYEMLEAHNRRHIWHMEQIVAAGNGDAAT